MKRAVLIPHLGHSTERDGLEMSTYRVCFAAVTVDFGFYQPTEGWPRAPPPATDILWPREVERPSASHPRRGCRRALLLRGARRCLPHLPAARVPERAGHLRPLRLDLDPRDHHLRRGRAGPPVGGRQVPTLQAAGRLRAAAGA